MMTQTQETSNANPLFSFILRSTPLCRPHATRVSAGTLVLNVPRVWNTMIITQCVWLAIRRPFAVKTVPKVEILGLEAPQPLT
jgi:hypothetical protein